MKLRTIGMAAVAALALVAGRAEAQDAGWDSNYGILFTLPNPFGGGSGTDVINSYDGLVGFQYNLTPQAGIRVGVSLLRKSCGDIETTDENNITYTSLCGSIPSALADPYGVLPAAYNSELGVDLSAEYLMRISPAAVSPYVGGGVKVNFDKKSLSGTVKRSDSPNQTKFDDSETTYGFGLVGKAGLEWRVHKVIAIFAEYEANIPIVEKTSFKVDQRATGNPTFAADGKTTSIFNLNTGVSHGGLLGVVAFF